MKKLLPHEKKLMAALQKRLPENTRCSLSYSRYVSFWTGDASLLVKPNIENTLRLRIMIFVGTKAAEFEWEGKKLEAGIKALDAWISEARRIAAGAVVAKQLHGQLALPAGDDR